MDNEEGGTGQSTFEHTLYKEVTTVDQRKGICFLKQ